MISEEELKTAVKAIMSRVKAIEDGIAFVRELVTALEVSGEAPSRNLLDANNEPRFEYLVNVKIPKTMFLTKEMEEYALDYKTKVWSPLRVKAMFDEFRDYYERVQDKPNGRWSHWRKVWYKWVRTQYDRETGIKARTPSRFERATIRE